MTATVRPPETAPSPTEAPAARHARAIAAGVGWTLVARAGSVAAALVAQVFLARILGPVGTGLLAGASSVLALAMLAADLGLNTSVSRLLAAAYYREPGRIRRILRIGLCAKVGLSGAVAAGLYFGAGPLARLLGGGDALALVLALAALQLVADNLATFSFRGLQGLHRPVANAAAMAISGIGSPAGATVLVVFGFGAAGAVAGRGLGAALAAAYGLAGLAAAARAASTAAPAAPAAACRGAALPASTAAEIAAYARRLFWVQLAYLVFFRLDRTLVFTFLGDRAAGLYALPANIVEQCLLPAVALSTVVAPYFAAADDPGRAPFLRSLLSRSVRIVTLVYAPAALGLCTLAPDAVRVVFGRAYADAVPIVRAYAFALLLLSHATLLGSILDYLGLARRRALAFGAAAGLDLAVNAVLLPRVGPLAAVAALLATFTPLVAFYLVSLARRSGLRVREPIADAARAAAAALIMAGVLVFAREMLSPIGPLRLAGLVMLGAAAYACALAALGGLPRGEIAALRRMLRRPAAER